MDQLREKAEKINAALRQALGMVSSEYGAIDAAARSFAAIDAEILRDQLEAAVKGARDRREIDLGGNVATASDAELLGALGFSAGADGRERFQDQERVWISLLRHNRDLPHVCGEFCPWLRDEEFALAGPAEADYFRADVEWHLGWMGCVGYQSSIARAVALYIFCLRNSRAAVSALLDAFDYLRARGGVFDDWDYPEIPISAAVKHIYDENQKIAEPGDDPYHFRLLQPRET